MTQSAASLLRTWAWTVIVQNTVILVLFGVAGLAFALGWSLPVQALGTLLGHAYGHFLKLLEWGLGDAARTEVWAPVGIEFGVVVYGLVLAWIVTRFRAPRGDSRLRSPFLFGLAAASGAALFIVFALLRT